MITKLRKFLEFSPQNGEWSIEDIKAHIGVSQFWSDRAMIHLLNEHKRPREVIEAMVECVDVLEYLRNALRYPEGSDISFVLANLRAKLDETEGM